MAAPDLAGFLALVETEFDLGPGSTAAETTVFGDLHLDSLHVVQLALLVDDVGDVEIPEGLLQQDDFTLGQVHHYLVVQQGHR
jgi:acyl carrier protein